jgi:2-succinyl-6-hydroxy-2,4-cyclohexadiene-1-carboxylate synthase
MAEILIRNLPQYYHLTPPTPSPVVVVFIHGWLLSAHYWQPLIQLLQSQVQCLSYDLRGFGRSATGNHPHTIQSFVEDLAEMLDRLHLGKVWLVGHSLGGTLALWSAHLLGDRVLGVICVNSGGGIYIEEDFRKLRLAGQLIGYLRPKWLNAPWLAPRLALQFTTDSVHQPLALGWGYQRLEDFVRADRRSVLGILLDSTTASAVHLLPPLVARLPQPAYFITGEQDRIMEAKFVRHLASFHALFSQGIQNYWALPHCGHMAMLEQTAVLGQIVQQLILKDDHERKSEPLPLNNTWGNQGKKW